MLNFDDITLGRMITHIRCVFPWARPFYHIQDMVGVLQNILESLCITIIFLSLAPKYCKIYDILCRARKPRGPLLFEEAQKGFE